MNAGPILLNTRKTLENSGKKCEGLNLPPEVFSLVNYITKKERIWKSKDLSPIELGIIFYREALLSGCNQYRQALKFLPQVIAKISEEAFSKEFRALFKLLGVVKPDEETQMKINGFPEYVKEAVNWWSSQVSVLPEPERIFRDSLEAILDIIPKNSENSEEIKKICEFMQKNPSLLHNILRQDIQVFSHCLAEAILSQVSLQGTILLFTFGGTSCAELQLAAQAAGIDLSRLQKNIPIMYVFPTSVAICTEAGIQVVWKVVWNK